MDPDSTTLCIILLLVFLLLKILQAMGEMIALYASEAKLENLADEGEERAKLLLNILKDPSSYLSSMQTLSNFVGFLCAMLLAYQFTAPLASQMASLVVPEEIKIILSILILSLILLAAVTIIGTLLPKKIIAHRLDKTSLNFAKLLDLAYKISKPFTAVFSLVSNVILLCLKVDLNSKVEQITEDEIRLMVDMGNEDGTIEKSEKDMINNIFEFDEKVVAEVMTHRTEMVAVDENATVAEVAATALKEGFSRIPVYGDNIDDIVGVIFVKDLLKYVENTCHKDEIIKPFIRNILFIPETKRCIELFKLFKVSKNQMAVVVDEYGGTSGVVTMEDLLEAIVGNMQDEYDHEEEDVLQISEKEFILSGALTLEDVEKAMEIDLSETEEHDTLGGYLINLLERIPDENEQPSVIADNIRFTVLQVKERRIMKVKAEILILNN